MAQKALHDVAPTFFLLLLFIVFPHVLPSSVFLNDVKRMKKITVSATR